MNKKNIQFVFWYDNEIGYSSKVVDIIDKIYKNKLPLFHSRKKSF